MLKALFYIFIATSVISHDVRNEKEKATSPPHEVIPKKFFDDLDKLEREEISSEPSKKDNTSEKISIIKSALNSYYTQFVDEKRILDEQSPEKNFHPKQDLNTVRLLVNSYKKGLSPTFVIRDSPVLYDLHKRLGNLYEKVGNREKAISSYLAAFRYRDLSRTERVMLSKKRNLEDYSETSLGQKNSHLSEKKKKEDNAKKLQDDEFQKNAEKAKLARRESSSARMETPEEIKKSREDFAKSIQENENSYNSSFNKNLKPLLDEKSKDESVTLVRLANLILQTEEENQEQVKLNKRRDLHGKEAFMIFENARTTSHPGYRAILELANRLEPDNAEILRNLAEEEKLAGLNQPALDHYLAYIKLASSNDSANPKFAESLVLVGAIYSERKDYLNGSEYYEKALSFIQENAKRKEAIFQIAEYHFKKTGNLDKSFRYYSEWLSLINNYDSEKELEIYLEESVKAFRSHTGIAAFYRKDKDRDQEINSLSSAYAIFKDFQKLLSVHSEKIIAQRAVLFTIKRKILDKTIDELLDSYREEEKKLALEEEKYKIIKSKYDSLKKTELLNLLAKLSEEERDFDLTRKYYSEILQIGNEVEINLALKNIERIRKMEQSGVFRERIEY